MLTGQEMVEAVLNLVSEKVDPGHTLDLSRFKRAFVLQQINLAQDSLSLAVPGLFDGVDSSLTTSANTANYTLPSTVGQIKEVSVNGNPLEKATKQELQGNAIRQGLVSWESITGTPIKWYQSDDKASLYLYPVPVTPSQTISIDGEVLLTAIADSSVSYPLNNLTALRKAQQLLIHKVAMVLSGMLEKVNLVAFFKGTSDVMQKDLETYWLVLRPTPAESTIRYKQTE
jgi:hypothetical protein